jgi:hypothetical protein
MGRRSGGVRIPGVDRGGDRPLRRRSRLARRAGWRLNRVEQALAALDEQIDAAMTLWARQLELLQTIPGVGLKTAQVIIAQTGADMSRFPSATGDSFRPAEAPPGWGQTTQLDTHGGRNTSTTGESVDYRREKP